MSLVVAREETALVDAVRAADDQGEPVLVFGGGSNLVVADGGWPGLAARVETRGCGSTRVRDGRVEVELAAGESWDEFVALCVSSGWSGVEALSGIPGSVGGTPIQNVGAYGQAAKQTIAAVRAYDRWSGTIVTLTPDKCRFTYRDSIFRREPDHFLVLAVTFSLWPSSMSRPVMHSELAEALGIEVGSVAPLADVRETALRLRRGKGMVLDATDHDTWSVGSFFKNPVLHRASFPGVRARIFARLDAPVELPMTRSGQEVTIAAGWLIENAGFAKGYPLEHEAGATVSLSTKHALALTNRGGGTTTELVALAREVAAGVNECFGVRLEPEPVFAGHDWAGPAD